MIRKAAATLALLIVLASCEKKRDSADSGPTSEASPGKTRVARPSRDIPRTHDKLRAALESAKSKPSGLDRDQEIAGIAGNAMESYPDIAGEAIRELPADFEGKDALIEAYVGKLTAQGKSDQALAWADSLGQQQDIASAREKIAVALAETNPDQAAKLLPASSFTASGTDPAAGQVLQNWTAKDPAAAVAWAITLPAGEARSAGMKAVMSQWINSDSSSALSWAASQSNSQVRGDAVRAIVGAVMEQPAFISSTWLEQANPALRSEIDKGIAAETAAQNEAAQPDPEAIPLPEPEPAPAPEPEPAPGSQ